MPEALAKARLAEQWDPAERRASGTPAGVLRVLPCNWEAVTLFISLPPSVWDFPPLGGRPRGLRRDQVMAELVLRGVRRRRWSELWEQICELERAQLVRKGA